MASGERQHPAWMAGAAGIMTLAVMTRATRGHTGQELTADIATQAIYAAIIIAVVARLCAVVHPTQATLLLHVAAFAWAAAFFGFALAYRQLLLGRVRRRGTQHRKRRARRATMAFQ